MGTIEILYYITYISPLILTIGLILGGIYFYELNTIHQLLLGYLLIALIFDLLSRFVGESFGNNLIFIPLFGFFELLIFSFIYLIFLVPDRNVALALITGMGLCYIGLEIWHLKNKDAQEFQTYARVVDAFILVLMSIIFYVRKMNEDKTIVPGVFMLNTLVLIYFSLHLIFILPINFLINESSQLKFYFWMVNLFVTVVFYSFIIYLIWKNGKTQT